VKERRKGIEKKENRMKQHEVDKGKKEKVNLIKILLW
jgi:hypothetical protein